MSLLTEARAEVRLKGPGCRAGIYLTIYDDLAEALDAVKAGTIEASALERALGRRWTADLQVPKLKGDTIRRHVAGECSCQL